MSDIVKRFTVETAEHRMTVLHDDGLYRHLRFRGEQNSFYWFELITVPGSLIFRGDGQSFVFARTEDMFEFFRGPVGRINPMYWAEKLTSGRGEGVHEYSRDVFEAWIKEAFVEQVRDREAPAGLGRAIRRDILDSDDTWTEEGAHRVLHEFAFYKNDADRYAYPRKTPDFEFCDTWELSFRGYDWWFLWSLHGIVWGIAQYDAHHGRPPQPDYRPRSQEKPAAGQVETALVTGGAA